MSETRPLAGRTAIVTGASRGLGPRDRRALRARPAPTSCSTARDAEALARRGRTSCAARGAGRVLDAWPATSSDPRPPRRPSRAREARAAAASTVLVNNAGVYGPIGPIEDVDWDEWDAGHRDQPARHGR